MVDVPRHLEPSDAERLHTALARMTPGFAAGQTRAVGLILNRDSLRANIAGSGEGEDSLDATSSKIDTFAITGTATSTFELTYDPLDDSWNPSLNGLMLDEEDYSISGQTLTVTSAADLFLGAATQGSPWELRVQYDYLTGVPTKPTESTSYPDEVLADDPWLYARLGDASGTTAVDSSTYEHTGSYAGSPTLGATGLITGGDTAVTFSGSNYAKFPDTHLTGAFPTTAAFSVEAWVDTTDVSIERLIGGTDNSGSFRWFQFRTTATNGYLELILFGSWGTATVTSTTSVTDGNTHHVVATWDGATVTLYVDGSSVKTQSVSGTMSTQTGCFVGARADAQGTANRFVGTIDEFAVYPSALSSTRVTAHYTAGTA